MEDDVFLKDIRRNKSREDKDGKAGRLSLRERQAAMRQVMIRLAGAELPASVSRHPTISMTIGIMLLYLRYLTAEMLQAVFPWSRGQEIAELKGKLEDRGKNFIAAKKYDGNKTVYFLSKDGYQHYMSGLPMEASGRLNPSMGPGIASEMKLWHDVHLRDVPCAFLKCQADVRWQTSVLLALGSAPDAGIGTSGRKLSPQPSGLASAGDIIADAIVTLDGKSHIIVEEDTGSQAPQVIRDKIDSYADYLESIGKYDYQLVFNVDARRDSEEKVRSGRSVIKNIKDMMGYGMMSSLSEAYERLDILLEHAPDNQKFENMRNLIDEYCESGGSIEAGAHALSVFVDRPVPGRMLQDRERAARIKEIIREQYAANEKFKKAVQKGLSVPVTCDIHREAYYIDAYDSGLMGEVMARIDPAGENGYKCESFRLIEGTVPSLRNFIIVKKEGEPVAGYLISEVSADITERIRMTELLQSFEGDEFPVHFLFIVSSHEDALVFSTESGCVRRFCDRVDPRRPYREYDVTVRFADCKKTGTGLGGLYIPLEDGSCMDVEEL